MNTERELFIKNKIKSMINQTHNEMIDYQLNQNESSIIIFYHYYDELIDQLFKHYNYMLYEFLERMEKINDTFKPIHINKKLSKHKSDDENNKKIDFNNITINI